jgi:hypothetical protein
MIFQIIFVLFGLPKEGSVPVQEHYTIFLLVAFFTTLFVIKERRKRVVKKVTSKKIVLYVVKPEDRE